MTVAPTAAPATLVSDGPALLALCGRLRAHPRVALDTETDSYLSYRASICLLQLATPDEVTLVDPLAVTDLAPLREVMADPAREWVLHDGEQDVSFMRRGLGLTPGRLFDTFVAARVAGVREVGLASLARTLLNVPLDKGEQCSDWRARPLRASQLTYAADDVRYLLPLRDLLEEKVVALGRADQASQEFERVRLRQLAERVADLEGWRSLPEAQGMDPDQRGVLRDLFALRERLAEARNAAAFRVLPNRGLAKAAQDRPRDAAALTRCLKAVGARVETGDDEAVLQVIREAAAEHGPLHPRGAAETEEEKLAALRFEQLREWRAGVAKAMDVEPPVVASNALLKALARRPATTLEQLGLVEDMLPWRLRDLGPGLLDVLAKPPDPNPRRRPRGRR